MLGVNKGKRTAYMIGDSWNPFKVAPASSAWVWVILVMLALVGIGIGLYVRQEKIRAGMNAEKKGEYDALNDEPEELGADAGDADEGATDGDAAQNLEDAEKKDEEDAPVPVAINDSVADESREEVNQE